ncbi:Collagen Alpha-1(V) Chain [Manis pentadactyla]|nr:Collagen Alpha-1(V) Chain [Manis pentadactyla]
MQAWGRPCSHRGGQHSSSERSRMRWIPLVAVNFKPLKDQEASTRFGIELSAKCFQMESAWKLTGHKKSVRITQVREEAGSDGPRMGRFKKPEDTKSGTEGEKSIPRVEAETAENLL